MIEKNEEVFEPQNGFVQTENFAAVYPKINDFILCSQHDWEDSRDGLVKEILDFKTTLLNPYKRVVGGQGRNINIFFLLAEAMWIFAGHKDVRFLTYFNKKMADFSDDGKVFHAPYGFRLRHWGVRSEDRFVEESMHAAQGYDQIADAIKIFNNNPNSRQVVMLIWNPDFDLGTNSKDIPCNDCVMMKIRNGKLYTTIQNRSNDLHWGLPTNIFQFGFMSEIIANVLGVSLGTQTHNSQSLHVYDWNNVAAKMQLNYKSGNTHTIYDIDGVKSRKIDFKFNNAVPSNRLREIDVVIERFIANLTKVAEGVTADADEMNLIYECSDWFRYVYRLLEIYLIYKRAITTSEDKRGEAEKALKAITDYLNDNHLERWDIGVLAMNFFKAKVMKQENSVDGAINLIGNL